MCYSLLLATAYNAPLGKALVSIFKGTNDLIAQETRITRSLLITRDGADEVSGL